LGVEPDVVAMKMSEGPVSRPLMWYWIDTGLANQPEIDEREADRANQ
jgi:hypothetical protein